MKTRSIFPATLLLAASLLASCQSKEANPWEEMNEALSQLTIPTFPDKTFIITEYYNGTDSLYTEAISRAIDTCSAQGGGTVLIPNGTYRTAPIRLKSNVNLHLSDSTVLQFVTDPALFPTVLTRIEGIDCHNVSPLIYAYGETNIALTGKGILDGQADTSNWFSPARLKSIDENGKEINEKTLLYQMMKDSIPASRRVFAGEKGIRPQFINLYKCKNILLEGFTLHRSPFWLIHPLLSENITVKKVILQSHGTLLEHPQRKHHRTELPDERRTRRCSHRKRNYRRMPKCMGGELPHGQSRTRPDYPHQVELRTWRRGEKHFCARHHRRRMQRIHIRHRTQLLARGRRTLSSLFPQHTSGKHHQPKKQLSFAY